jgi:transposase
MAMTVRRIRGGRLHIVNQPDANGFEVLPKRRLVERAFARISRNRCLARDFEHYATAAAALDGYKRRPRPS